MSFKTPWRKRFIFFLQSFDWLWEFNNNITLRSSRSLKKEQIRVIILNTKKKNFIKTNDKNTTEVQSRWNVLARKNRFWLQYTKNHSEHWFVFHTLCAWSISDSMWLYSITVTRRVVNFDSNLILVRSE